MGRSNASREFCVRPFACVRDARAPMAAVHEERLAGVGDSAREAVTHPAGESPVPAPGSEEWGHGSIYRLRNASLLLPETA